MKERISFECSDFDLANECIDYCLANRNDCLRSCLSVSACSFDCNHGFVGCVDSCPCQNECPAGCRDCLSAFCVCRDPEENPEYIECEERILLSFTFFNIFILNF